jgi:hypothetical protein
MLRQDHGAVRESVLVDAKQDHIPMCSRALASLASTVGPREGYNIGRSPTNCPSNETVALCEKLTSLSSLKGPVATVALSLGTCTQSILVSDFTWQREC